MQQRRKHPCQVEAVAKALDRLISEGSKPSGPDGDLKRDRRNSAYPGAKPGAIRDADDIISEFDMSEEEFSSLFNDYKFSLSISNDAVSGWNEDINDISRLLGALSEEEIKLAKSNFQRAILNRIIVRKVADRAL